jgi:PadR family transcriptional regulator
MANLPRLSANELLILRLLVARGEAYGLELVELSEGRLKRGTVYVTLSRMEDKGYVASSKEDTNLNATGPPRRMYTPSGYGAQVLKAWEMASFVLGQEVA